MQHILINKTCFDKISRFRQYVPLITKLASRSYYRFIKYNYWSVNYKLWHSINAFNYLKARQEVENAPIVQADQRVRDVIQPDRKK